MQGDIDFLAAPAQTSPLVQFLPLILIGAAFYFFLIRPQNKRRREQLQMQNSVEPGARVQTIGGVHATVVAVEDDVIVLEIAPGVEARFVRQAVAMVLSDTDDDDVDGVAGTENSADSADSADQAAEDSAGTEDAGKTREVTPGGDRAGGDKTIGLTKDGDAEPEESEQKTVGRPSA